MAMEKNCQSLADLSFKMSQVAATGLAGIVTGALTFGSFVDTRTFRTLVTDNEEDTVKKIFPLWWPNGRDLMVPLLALSSVAHGAAYYVSGEIAWLVSGGLVFGLGPYTKLVLGEDIEGLLNAEGKDVGTMTKRFCNLHHVRTVAASIAFCIALSTLADSGKPKKAIA